MGYPSHEGKITCIYAASGFLKLNSKIVQPQKYGERLATIYLPTLPHLRLAKQQGLCDTGRVAPTMSCIQQPLKLQNAAYPTLDAVIVKSMERSALGKLYLAKKTHETVTGPISTGLGKRPSGPPEKRFD